jgi:hypothetical protein
MLKVEQTHGGEWEIILNGKHERGRLTLKDNIKLDVTT